MLHAEGAFCLVIFGKSWRKKKVDTTGFETKETVNDDFSVRVGRKHLIN